jgi:hypothetical protein
VTSVPPPGRPAAPPPPPRRRAPAAVRSLAATGAIALATWGASAALAHDRPPELRGLAATGAVRIVSPEDGTAVLAAAHLVPGQSVTGLVHLTNSGDADGALQLARTGITETPGAGGGRLSQALQLTLDDVTTGTPQPVFSGGLADFDLVRLGRLPAGAWRTYRLTATLPDGGVPASPLGGDNALQGGSIRVDWLWGAIALTPAVTPTPPRTPTPAPTVTRGLPTPQPIQSGGESPAASVLTLRIPWQRVMMTRGITVRGTCDRLCRLTFTAKVQTAPRHGHRRTVMGGKVFRVAGTRRTLPPGAERRIKLRLTPKAVLRLHQVLLTRGRAAVLVDARVRSALGAATVKRRIVIVTSRRAARHRATQHR